MKQKFLNSKQKYFEIEKTMKFIEAKNFWNRNNEEIYRS